MIAKIFKTVLEKKKKKEMVALLSHSVPDPLKPVLQSHVNMGTASMQVALSWQLSLPTEHSLISAENRG